MAFLTSSQLNKMGFRHVGKNVKISSKASFYNAGKISVGDDTRIDDFCVLSAGKGGIKIGRNTHISVYTSIIGEGEIYIGDFVALSSKVSVYSSNDDYSGEYMTNPTVNKKYTNVVHEDVYIGKHVIVGSGSIILPGVVIEEGACVGALSLVKEKCRSFFMYGGIPAKLIKKRSKRLLSLEREYIEKYK